MAVGLTPEEDAELRRLAALAEFGALDPDMGEVVNELRSRDRRTSIRTPRDVVVPRPRQAKEGPVIPETMTV